jgi:hypothetical protein
MTRILEGRDLVIPTVSPALLRRGAVAVAAARVAIGVTALGWPAFPTRPWVGGTGDDLTARVFGRALGGRDLALGLGTLAALRGPAAEEDTARAWIAVGALSDVLDVGISLMTWRELPKFTRWLVAGSAAGAAAAGLAALLDAAGGKADLAE